MWIAANKSFLYTREYEYDLHIFTSWRDARLRERERQRERDRQRNRERDRQRNRERDRQRNRERDRER